MATTDGSGSASTVGNTPPFYKDRVQIATLVGALAALLISDYFEIRYNVLPNPLFFFTSFIIVIVATMIAVTRYRSRARPAMPPGRAVNVKHAQAWYLASILTGLLGGLAGFSVTRKYDTAFAERLLILAIPATLVYMTILAMLTYPSPVSIRLP